jgi:hypothetical protein
MRSTPSNKSCAYPTLRPARGLPTRVRPDSGQPHPSRSFALLPCKDRLQDLFIPLALPPQRECRKAKMKRLTSLAIVIFTSLGISAFSGQPLTSSTPAVSPPSGFFRANEFETGAFGTFARGVGSSANSDSHAWGGGLDVTHWLPWKYGGIRFQGTGTNTR